MYVQYNRKATSNNPLMDNTVTSGLKVLKCLFWCMICHLVQLFFSPTHRRTPPVSGHLPLVPGVSTYGRFDCTQASWKFWKKRLSQTTPSCPKKVVALWKKQQNLVMWPQTQDNLFQTKWRQQVPLFDDIDATKQDWSLTSLCNYTGDIFNLSRWIDWEYR